MRLFFQTNEIGKLIMVGTDIEGFPYDGDIPADFFKKLGKDKYRFKDGQIILNENYVEEEDILPPVSPIYVPTLEDRIMALEEALLELL